ncbi:MAG: tributyrin esterase, partial [Hadesarchaea archaeon]|nr:tributyrin esterase [Hadesarchaea archaeon]
MNVRIIDVSKMSVKEVNRILKRCRSKIKLLNPNSAHFLAAGVCNKLSIEIEGSVGYYLGTCMRGPEIRVTGNAGW